MAWDDGLVGVALNIAGSDESPLRVLAGPGTGKTYAMKRRVMRLLEEGAVPQRILACTFTRTAARDIAREIAELGVEGAELVWAGTLHGLCFSILQRNEVLAATGRLARPLPASEERFLLQDLRAFGGVREAEKKLEAFGAAWARLQSDDPGWPQDAQDQAFQAALLTWLTFHGAMLIRRDGAGHARVHAEQPAVLVVVMGCIEGMIPRIDYTAPQADRQRSLEEQRRLFYVALTRTTETLILSSVTHIPVQQAFQMGLGVAGGQVHASRFINELGPTRPAPIGGEALV